MQAVPAGDGRPAGMVIPGAEDPCRLVLLLALMTLGPLAVLNVCGG